MTLSPPTGGAPGVRAKLERDIRARARVLPFSCDATAFDTRSRHIAQCCTVFPHVACGPHAARRTLLVGCGRMKDLVPQKRVAAELGVSRSSLWRASRSAIPGFPSPVVLRARVYWVRSDLPALRIAMDRFQGRSAFEAERRHAKARAALAEATGLKPKRRKQASAIPQPDLFDAPDTAGPGGAERANRARRC